MLKYPESCGALGILYSGWIPAGAEELSCLRLRSLAIAIIQVNLMNSVVAYHCKIVIEAGGWVDAFLALRMAKLNSQAELFERRIPEIYSRPFLCVNVSELATNVG